MVPPVEMKNAAEAMTGRAALSRFEFYFRIAEAKKRFTAKPNRMNEIRFVTEKLRRSKSGFKGF
jgi:hypothetical protein